ncbi:MAG: CCA tRNA nucleotidyltransferase [Pseudomonadota bacterium]|jgi:tRNA nucleotidyltransferase (CCA-adding enzyme)
MEKFRPRGSHSCKPTQSRAEAKAALDNLCNSQILKRLYNALQPAELYLVGGCVRDAFFGKTATDLDLTTNLEASEVRDRCVAHGLRVIETGIQHGTVLVLVDDTHLELTTFREPADRTTQIRARDISIDLSGRDFTINALAFCVSSRQLIEVCGGIQDLIDGQVRAVGDPTTRFKEDPLRILRMIRFGPAIGRTIDPDTLQAATATVADLATISVERIRHEVEQILKSPYPAAGIIMVKDIGGLPWTIPELLPAVGFEQNRYHIHDVFDHTMAVLDRTPCESILRWAALFHDIGKPHTLSVDESGDRHFYLHEIVSTELSWKRMEHLKFSHEDMKRISSVVRHHMRPLNCGPAGVRRLIRDLGDNLSLWRVFKEADSSPTINTADSARVTQAFDALLETEQRKMAIPSYGRLAINGEDLKAIGVKPGPKMGHILKQLEEIIIEDPQKNSRERLIELAKSLVEPGS